MGDEVSNSGLWNGMAYFRHGGEHHSSWWKQGRNDKITSQTSSTFDINTSISRQQYDQDIKIAVYVKVKKTCSEKMRERFLQYIGGQNHLRCGLHRCPLINIPQEKGTKCSGCLRTKRCCFGCTDVLCSTKICRQCYDGYDDQRQHFIFSPPTTIDNNNGGVYAGEDAINVELEDGSLGNDEEEDDIVLGVADGTADGGLEDGSEQGTALGILLGEDEEDEDSIQGRAQIPADDDDDSSIIIGATDASGEEIHDFSDLTYLATNADVSYFHGFDPNEDDDLLRNENEPLVEQQASRDPIDDYMEHLPTTNASEQALDVEVQHNCEKSAKYFHSVHILFNQVGSLLARDNHPINGYLNQKNYLQTICSKDVGESIPLVYFEGMLFPSIFYKMVIKDGTIVGAIPSCLYTKAPQSQFGFASLKDHMVSRLTCPFSTTSTNPTFLPYAYDALTNLSINQSDQRLILNRGLSADPDSPSGLSLNRASDTSTLYTATDSRKMVKNLSASQKYHPMDLFLTFTCNQKKHFGVRRIKNWIDSMEWTKSVPDWDSWTESDREKYRESMIQAASGHLLRNWLETRELLLEYLLKCKSSPFRFLKFLFARDEYQATKGNLPHIHLLVQLITLMLRHEHMQFLEELVRAAICEIVRFDEVQDYIDEGIFTDEVEDVKEIEKLGNSILPHRCDAGCMYRVKPGNGPDCFRCRKIDNLLRSNDNTKHTYQPLPVRTTPECQQVLQGIQLMDEPTVDEFGYTSPTEKYHHPLLNPCRHIPPTNPNDVHTNISPVTPYLFVQLKSMQNTQIIAQTNGCNKYCNKYLNKQDEQCKVIVSTNSHRHGTLVAMNYFRHNTGITTSRINEELHFKEVSKNRYAKHPQANIICNMHMLHSMLGYKEVTTNLRFESIPTMPLELRACIEMRNKKNWEPNGDVVYIGQPIVQIRLDMELEDCRQVRQQEKLILEGTLSSNQSVDKISIFGVRPPELRNIISQVGVYYRFFSVDKRKKLSDTSVEEKLDRDIYKCCWIDGFHCQVKLRAKAIEELMTYLNGLQTDENFVLTRFDNSMLRLFRKIQSQVLTYTGEPRSYEGEDRATGDIDDEFRTFALKELIVFETDDALPVPVYSSPKPSMGHQFILHVLLSLGSFETEIDLTLQPSLRASLRYAKLIGPDNDNDSLQRYSRELMSLYFHEEVANLSNSMSEINNIIVEAQHLFDDVIIHDRLPISGMPPMHISAILASQEEKDIAYKQSHKRKMIDAAFQELSHAVESCHIPTAEELMEVKDVDSALEWNAYERFVRSDQQSEASYKEQQFAIKTCVNAIDKLCDPMFGDNGNSFIKGVTIHGPPGSGKTFVLSYILIYALSKGIVGFISTLQARRACAIGGSHFHILFGLQCNNRNSPFRAAELAIINLQKSPEKLQFLKEVNILFIDEEGQVSAELLSTLDMILRRIRNTNIFFGGVLVIGTMDHMQFNPIDGRPFLTSSHVISCFNMVRLQHSVRAHNDPGFQRFQQIARMHPSKYDENPDLIDEFETLVSDVFSFAPTWQDPLITTQTYRLYARKTPARQAESAFIEQVKSTINAADRVESIALDEQRQINSRADFARASEEITIALDRACKEPRHSLFYKGAIFEFTFNKAGSFSKSQLCIMYDLPSLAVVRAFGSIEVLAAPPGVQDVQFDESKSVDDYIAEGWTIQKVEPPFSSSPRIHRVGRDGTQGKRRQYGLKHRVTSTIHSSIGDTLSQVAIEISNNADFFKLWDKAQLIVGCSRTKRGKDTILVGNKANIIEAFTTLVRQRTQWSDYMEHVLDMVTINEPSEEQQEESDDNALIFNPGRHFPYRLCNFALPNCKTGFCYFLVSTRDPNFFYIGQTKDISTRIVQHNSGHGSTTTSPLRLRPYAVLAYVCGFDGNKHLMLSVENQWQSQCHELRRNGITDVNQLILSIQPRLQRMVNNPTNFLEVTQESPLRLVRLYR